MSDRPDTAAIVGWRMDFADNPHLTGSEQAFRPGGSTVHWSTDTATPKCGEFGDDDWLNGWPERVTCPACLAIIVATAPLGDGPI